MHDTIIKFSDYWFLTFLTGSRFENRQLVNRLPFNITSTSYQAVSCYIQLFGHNTPMLQTDRTTVM